MRRELNAGIFGWLLAMGLLLTTTATVGADDPNSRLFKFDLPMLQITESSEPTDEFWQYYVTVPGEDADPVTDKEEVDTFIIAGAEGDENACRLQSRENYTGLARLVGSEFIDARELSWKWSVSKHPHNGTLGGSPNDQSLSVYVIFRPREPENQDDYSALGFCWTAKTNVDIEPVKILRMPWPDSPVVRTIHMSLRDGPMCGGPEEYAEKVDFRAEYQKAFKADAPLVYAVMVIGDSNHSPAKRRRMLTDAIIRDIRLHK